MLNYVISCCCVCVVCELVSVISIVSGCIVMNSMVVSVMVFYVSSGLGSVVSMLLIIVIMIVLVICLSLIVKLSIDLVMNVCVFFGCFLVVMMFFELIWLIILCGGWLLFV